MKHVRIERDGRIATVALDRGDKANALSLSAMRELTEAARRIAERAAGLPPAQVRMIKELIDANAHALGRATAAIDRDQFILSQQSGDFEEGVLSFLERRPAKFTGK